MASAFSLLPVFAWVLRTSAKVSVLIIFLLLVKLLFRRKLTATVHYLLWAVVIVGLLLPWTPSSSWSIDNFTQPFTPKVTAGSMSYSLDNNFQHGVGEITTVPPGTNSAGDGNYYPAAGESQPQVKSILWSFAASPLTHKLLLMIWLFGMAVFLVSTVVVNIRFSRSIRGQTLRHWFILVGLEAVIERLNIKRDIPLTFTPAVGTPSLFGLFNPRILIPEALTDHFTQEQLKFILVHELWHYKRQDILVNWLMQALLILHWFNPLIWYAFRKLREDQEQACDAMTVKYFGQDNSTGYAGTLIKLLECSAGPLRMANLTGLSGSSSLLKRRLMNIKNYPQSSFALTVFIIGIVILAAFVTLANAEIIPRAENESLRLPSTAVISGETKTLTISFPVSDQFNNGKEQWILDRNTSDHLVLKAMLDNQEKAAFPIKTTGDNQAAGKITLEGKDYSVVSITLNNDQTSGLVTFQSSSVLPKSIQSLSISDDSAAGNFWSPNNQKEVLDQVTAWLKSAKPYPATLPSSDSVNRFIHHNIGSSALHIKGTDNFETLIYPAWYVKTGRQDIDARSISNYIHYRQDVVVIIEARTNFIYYFESAPLYNWLKNREWQTEFSQNPALTPLYQTNENGQTYGTDKGPGIYGNPRPDLVAAEPPDGPSGYVKYEDLEGPQPKNPEEAIKMQKEGVFSNRKIPLYAADGKTVIGSFK
ncbi:MAG: M56 family metallopeptidase [Desulfitobacteriaceae bacterium]